MSQQHLPPDALTIAIIANGQERVIPAGSTVADFLQSCNIAPARVVVQLQGDIIPRHEYVQANLHQGSRLEIVTLVGGG